MNGNTPQGIYENRSQLGIKQSLELLINQVNSSDKPEIRREAVKYIGEIGLDECFSTLETVLLSDQSDLVRIEAASAMGRLNTMKVLEPLKWIILNEKFEELRKRALKSFQNVCNPNEEISFFTQIMGDSSNNIRKMAENSIYKIKPLTRIKIVVNNLQTKNELLKLELLGILLNTLWRFSTHKCQNLIKQIPNYNSRLIQPLIKFLKKSTLELVNISTQALIKLEDLVLDDLIIALDSENYLIRKNSARILGNFHEKKVVEVLINKLDDIYGDVSISCIEALGNIGDESAIEPLMSILDIEDENFEYVDYDLKWYVIESIKNIYLNNPYLPLEFLYGSVNMEKNIYKESIPIILGEIRKSEGVKKLIELLNDPHLETRKNVLIAMGKICSKRCLNPIANVISEDSYWLLKKVAIDALDSICENESEDENFIQDVVQIMIRALDDENFSVRASAVNLLGNYGDEKVLEPLLKCLGDFHSKVRLLATKAIKNIESKLELEKIGE